MQATTQHGDRYFDFCEQLWTDWLARPLEVPELVREEFDTDAAVEPYIRYGKGARPLVVLLTNPGKTMPHQKRVAVEAGDGPVKMGCSYADVAQELGKHYLTDPKLGKAARRRNESLLALAASLGYDGFIAVECCPFHSKSLPKKNKLLAVYKEAGRLQEYLVVLREFLRPRPVVIVSAVSSHGSLVKESPLSDWLAWQADLTGIDRGRAEFLPLLTKGEHTTCAALIDFVGEVPKVLVRMMGGNHLPSHEHLQPLVNRLASRG